MGFSRFKTLSKQTGSALIISLATLVSATILVTAELNSALQQEKSTGNHLNGSQALNIAETGIRLGIAEITNGLNGALASSTLLSNSDFGGVMAAHEQVEVAGNPNLTGVIIAEDAANTDNLVTSTNFISGNMNLHYDGDLTSAFDTDISKLSWQQI